MKKVIIAIDNKEMFKRFKNFFSKEEYYVYEKDYIYEDALFENVEKNNVDMIILNESIIENKKRYKTLLNNKCRIILFLDNIDNINIYRNYGFKEIFDKEFMNVEFLKKYLLKKEEMFKTSSFNNTKKIQEELKEFKKFKFIKKAEIIVFTGNVKSGKTTIALNMIKILENKKILYINSSIYMNNDINYIFNENVDNKEFKRINNNEITFFINKKENIKDILEKNNSKYDFIIIDLDFNLNYKFLKCIFIYASKIFFVIQPLQLEIYKSLEILEIFKNNKIVNEEKVFIIFNKYDYTSVNIDILKEIFKKYKIECVIKNKIKYRRLINKDIKYGYRSRR